MLYQIYDLATGRTGIYGTTAPENFASKAAPGQGVIEGNFPNCIVDADGVPHPIPVLPFVIGPAQVKLEAARRLAATDWMVIRAAEGGTPVPEDIAAARATIRASSNAIEAMTPIPRDFDDDRYWSAP